MMKKRKSFSITEYGSFICGREVEGYKALPERTFRLLREFVLIGNSGGAECFTLSIRRGVGEVITACNYVGVLSLPDGSSIQILPKIYSDNERDSKQLFLNILRTIRKLPRRSLPSAQADTAEMDLLELFIRMFLDEIFFLSKRGLRCGYQSVQENQTYMKGKLLAAKQLRFNSIHQERSYVEYDIFTVDRPENRLIKSTLSRLYSKSTSMKNRRDIKILLDAFQEVSYSSNYREDFSRCTQDRSMKDYRSAMHWCRIFLNGESFLPFAGREDVLALLYPMEKLFEQYTAVMLGRILDPEQFTISAQDQSYTLFDSPKQFRLRPDLVIRRKDDNAVFVLDTKWKRLNTKQENYGISPADMYQMYAYQNMYHAEHVTLLYPKMEGATITIPDFRGREGLCIRIRFLDPLNIQVDLKKLIREL